MLNILYYRANFFHYKFYYNYFKNIEDIWEAIALTLNLFLSIESAITSSILLLFYLFECSTFSFHMHDSSQLAVFPTNSTGDLRTEASDRVARARESRTADWASRYVVLRHAIHKRARLIRHRMDQLYAYATARVVAVTDLCRLSSGRRHLALLAFSFKDPYFRKWQKIEWHF